MQNCTITIIIHGTFKDTFAEKFCEEGMKEFPETDWDVHYTSGKPGWADKILVSSRAKVSYDPGDYWTPPDIDFDDCYFSEDEAKIFGRQFEEKYGEENFMLDSTDFEYDVDEPDYDYDERPYRSRYTGFHY